MGTAALVFFLHGLGALILESVWVKDQVALFGSVPAAPGSVLVACFLGIAAGSWLWRGRGPAALARGAFAARMTAALAVSLLLPALLLRAIPLFGPVAGGAFLSTPALWLTAFLAVLPAAIGLGGFFPALGNVVRGRGFVALYGTEAAGAVAGAGLGAFVLPPAIGYRATGAVGGLAILLALAAARRIGAEPEAALATDDKGALPPRWLLTAFASGLLSLCLEALWIRLVALSSDDSVYAFGSVSTLLILLLAAAALLVALLPESLARDERLRGLVILLAVAGGLLAGAVWVALTHGLSIRLVTAAQGFAASFALAAPLALAGSLFASFLFPIVLRAASPGEGAGAAFGPLVAANSLGSAVGVGLASFVMLPHVGIWGTLFATLAGYLLLLATLRAAGPRWSACALGVLLLVLLDPLRHPLVTPADPFAGPPGKIVSVREGDRGIVSVIDYPGRARTLWLNNTYLLEAFTGDARATARMGILPAALHPRARRLAMIGVGTGITASGFLDTGLEEILLVELIPEVAQAAAKEFAGYNRNVLADPRVRLVVDDGRHALARSRERFDIVCVDLVTPWNEGAAALYTTENFRAVRARLAAGGLFVLWLPAFQLDREEFLLIARTLAEAFPSVSLWQLGSTSENAAVALVASAGPLDTAEIAAGANAPLVAGVEADPLRLHESGVLSHYVGPVDLADPLWRGVGLNTLDRPLLEFLAARGGRGLLKGRAYLDLAETFFAEAGNPGGRIFTAYGADHESWRLTGRDMNRYAWYLGTGEFGKAAALEARIGALPAFGEAGRGR